MNFKLVSSFKPSGDQPQAIKQLSKNLKSGVKHQTLLGVTGSGKTFTMANVIEKIQKPVLIISHNKTLCAQLYQEFKDFFPNNAIHYFVSYYDYYQPEAYIPQSDTYIEKDAKINEEIDRMRHKTVQDIAIRKDVIVCASVSCIYNIGSPENYKKVSLEIKQGQKIKRKDFIHNLINLQYQRNDILARNASPARQPDGSHGGGRSDASGDFKPGVFRARGDIIEIYLVTGKETLKIEFNGDKIDKISIAEADLSLRYTLHVTRYTLFPAHFWIAPEKELKIATENIKLELQEQLKELKKQKKLLEAERLEQRTNFDLEMLKESGFCHGIENYSRHLEFRKPGQAPFSLIDYFDYFYPSSPAGSSGPSALRYNSEPSALRYNSGPSALRRSRSSGPSANGLLIFIDESHMTLPQIKAMAIQDKIRKKTLIDYGFRLPSAQDNRPLRFEEFEQRAEKVIYVSATPSLYEKNKSGEKYIIQQLVRPTGLLEPLIEIKSTKNQLNSLILEIKKNIGKKQRTLVVALTKKMAELISEHLTEQGIKSQWLHSEIKTLERPEILKDFRQGKYDVLVGINLLREGLDLPEVSLVAILDADKEGFLRNETTLIQTMGRAARHSEGRIILYADKTTESMKKAINEINRRRKIQEDYNKKHKITPKAVEKNIKEWIFAKNKIEKEELGIEFWAMKDKKVLEKEMKKAARELNFERAAELRDIIKKLNS